MVIHRNQIFYNSKLLCLWWEKSCFDLHFIFVHILHTDFAIWLITVFMTFGALSFFSSRIMCNSFVFWQKEAKESRWTIFSLSMSLWPLAPWPWLSLSHFSSSTSPPCWSCPALLCARGLCKHAHHQIKTRTLDNFSLNYDRVKLFSSQPMG